MKILVIGSGGREHALAHTFWKQGHTIYSHPGNPGIQKLSIQRTWSDEYLQLAKAVKQEQIDLTVVGPELHLEQGIQDVFAAQNLLLFGPSQRASQMESSKAFAKKFMAKYRIPSARFEICTASHQAKLAAKSLFCEATGVVVKASGLASGKGVFCCKSYEAAEEAIEQIMDKKIYGKSGLEVVIEEFLTGPELSFQAICDGKKILPLLAAQDHKRLHDFDLGPNTGGMGAIAPLPFLKQSMIEEIEQTIIQPTLNGLQKEGISYRGLLYFGLMLTKDGPKVLEYNCRFGDPETQAILPLLETDLAELMIGCARGDLGIQTIRWKPQASCCVVLAAKGYPENPLTGAPIGMLKDKENLFFFQAGTALYQEGRHVTMGGRVLGITALGNTLDEAIAKVYEAIREFACPWAHFRRDIGRAALSATL